MGRLEQVQVLVFPQRGDERGNLAIIEGALNIPFEIKRVFYTYGTSADAIRGQHANRNSEFVLINVAGSSRIRVKDGLGREAAYCLDRPDMGLYLPRMIWKEMFDFSEDSVQLCLASTHYDATEYIKDYAQFEREMKDAQKHLNDVERDERYVK